MIESVSSYCYGGVDREGGARIVGQARTNKMQYKHMKWINIKFNKSKESSQYVPTAMEVLTGSVGHESLGTLAQTKCNEIK